MKMGNNFVSWITLMELAVCAKRIVSNKKYKAITFIASSLAACMTTIFWNGGDRLSTIKWCTQNTECQNISENVTTFVTSSNLYFFVYTQI